MSDIEFDCPKCGGHLAVDSAGAGRVVPCPMCTAQIRIPRASPDAVLSAVPTGGKARNVSPTLIGALVALVVLCAGLGAWVFVLTRSHASSETAVAPETPAASTVVSAPLIAAQPATAPSVLEKVVNRVLPDVQLSGEVFIVTKGGQNFKLGLVTVGLIPLETLTPYLIAKKEMTERELARLNPMIEAANAEAKRLEKIADSKRAALNSKADRVDWTRLNNECDDARNASQTAAEKLSPLYGERHKFLCGAFYFGELPAPIRTAKTNADGKFELQVPRSGSFALCASTSRQAGGEEIGGHFFPNTEHYYWLVRFDNQGPAKQSIMLSNDNLTSSGSPDSLLKTIGVSFTLPQR